MIVSFSGASKAYLLEVKAHIAKDSPSKAKSHILNLINRIETLLAYPRIGKVNAIYNDQNIRELFVDGYKVIYKLRANSILVLMIYKNIDFDESDMEL